MISDALDLYQMVEEYKRKVREMQPGEVAVIPVPTHPAEKKLAMAFAEWMQDQGFETVYYPEIVVLTKKGESDET